MRVSSPCLATFSRSSETSHLPDSALHVVYAMSKLPSGSHPASGALSMGQDARVGVMVGQDDEG